jgi:hypothetical protein
VGDNQEDTYAVRRAELDGQFRALPRAGTAAYWRRIEGTEPPPLEVLVRCVRERLAAAALTDAHRIFEVIVRHIQARMGPWTGKVAAGARSGMRPQLREDLEQECYLRLWDELKGDGPTFLLERFGHGLGRLQQHVAQEKMQQEGEWQRKGIGQSTRVPRSQIDSVLPNAEREQEAPLIEQVPHPGAEADFDRVELSDLLALVMNLPADQRAIILDRFSRDRPQEETAANLGISARMVRYRLRNILHDLGVRYRGGEEGNRG